MEKQIVVRAKAFTGMGIQSLKCLVEGDGTVRVYDSVAGYYTTCHSLSKSAERRIRRLASRS